MSNIFLINNISFRDLYHKFCFIYANDALEKMLNNTSYSLGDNSTGVVAYGYVDHVTGFTFEVLATATISDGNNVRIISRNESSCLKLRCGGVSECKVTILSDAIYEKFQEKVENLLSCYESNKNILPTRNIEIIDSLRYETNPDDIMVLFDNGKDVPEGCWVRCEEIFCGKLIGMLLNEPNSNFGVHRGDFVPFEIKRRQDGSVYCEAIL